MFNKSKRKVYISTRYLLLASGKVFKPSINKYTQYWVSGSCANPQETNPQITQDAMLSCYITSVHTNSEQTDDTQLSTSGSCHETSVPV